jgi:integrase
MFADGGNLWLQVTAGKDGGIHKSWVFRFAVAGTGRERQMGLGPVHTIGLAEAREKARSARLLLLEGKDPLDEKQARAASAVAAQGKCVTFEQAAKAYLEEFEKGWKNRIHRAQWRQTLDDYILPRLGKLDVQRIDTADVLQVLEQRLNPTDPTDLRTLWTARTETASRIRGRIETVLNFAGCNGANPARWKGHLEYRLRARKKARDVQHLPAMPYTEIAAFMAKLRAVDSFAAMALEFTILTAARSNEVLGAIWDEIDLEAKLWTVPKERTKRDRVHVIPLSDAALAMLRRMEAIRCDGRLFPVHRSAMLLTLRELQSDATVHGFRSCFRSWAGACTDTPRDIAELALGHSIGSAVEQAYMRDQLLIKRAKLMQQWADFCGAAPASVVRIDVGRTKASEETPDSSEQSRGHGIRPTAPSAA